ncbi:MAG: hypothetical protein FWD77_09675 [Betaproteobacteria bacterium]|nr:hypothetical protein [Betaproteobacteria bacterium]
MLLPARRYFLNWYPTWIFIIWISVFFLSFAILSALTSLHLEGALFLGLLCSIFALAVSGVIFGNAFMTDISFCVDHQWRWWMVPSNLAIMALTIMVLIVVFGLVSSGYFWHVYPYWLGMPAILVASARSLLPGFSVTKTNEKYVYIKGCGEAFLASLPQIGREEHKNA